MIEKEDFLRIIQEVNKLKDRSVLAHEFQVPELKMELNIRTETNPVYIDSSYVSGIVGPFSYIYARAAAISKTDLRIEKDFIIIPESYVSVKDSSESLSISEIAEILSKNLEYKLASQYSDSLIVIDGSVLADAILYGKKYKFVENEVDERYQEFRNNFEVVFKRGFVSIAKRIVGGNFFSTREFSDLFVLLERYPTEEFYTGMFLRDLKPKIPEFPYKVKALYFRARRGDHIYRLEASEFTNDETIVNFIYNEIYSNKRYPRGLKLAHNKCKITYKEKNLLESILKKALGYSKTVGWDTK